MDERKRKEVVAAFRDSPDEFIAFLVKERLLTGDVRSCLGAYILQHSSRPWCQAYHWLPLMPKFISLVSVEGFCNLSCRMCGGSRGELKHLDSARFETLLDHIPTAELIIMVAGNSEPLLNPDFVGNIEIMKARFLNWQVVTNAHLLRAPAIEALVGYPHAVEVNVSLDAATATTYQAIRGASFDHVLGKLRALRDAAIAVPDTKLHLSLLMVGMEDNIAELPKFIELAAELKAWRVKVDHMNGAFQPGDFQLNPNWERPVRKAIALADELGIRLKLPDDSVKKLAPPPNATPTATNAATAPQEPPGHLPPDCCCDWINSLHIGIDGDIHPCCFTTDVKLGNIYHQPLPQNQRYLDARRRNRRQEIFGSCPTTKNCVYIQQLSQHPERLEELLRHPIP